MVARTRESSCGSISRGRRCLARQWSSSPNSASYGHNNDRYRVEQQGVSMGLESGDINSPTLTLDNQR